LPKSFSKAKLLLYFRGLTESFYLLLIDNSKVNYKVVL